MDYEKKQRIYKTIMLVVLTATVTLLVSTVVIYNMTKGRIQTKYVMVSPEDTGITSKMNSLKNIIDKYYIGDTDNDKMIEQALKGYVTGTEDAYAEYMNAEEWEDFEDDTLGNFIGIGIQMMNTDDNKIVIVGVFEDTPAQKAGLKPGDIIKKVNDEDCTTLESSKISKKIKGEEGTEVVLEVDRNGEILTISMKRAKVYIHKVSSKVLENNIGYMKFTSFDEETASQFEEAYKELKSKNITSLIVDIRNNTGGIVDQAIEIADLFLEKDAKIVSTKSNENEKEYKAKRDKIIDVPVVFLVNEYSASASEILIGALKDNKVATIIGTKTYGKGVMQNMYKLSDGSVIKITTTEFFTPNNNTVDKVGIEPDIEVKLPEEEDVFSVEEENDTQLKKAIENLK